MKTNREMTGRSIHQWLLGLSGDRESSLLGKQRFIIFIITAFALLALNVFSFFTQPLHTEAFISAVITAALTAVVVFSYFYWKIPLRWALTSVVLLAAIQNLTEVITYCLNYTPEVDLYIISDLLMSILLVMTALVSYLRFSPSIVSALSIFSYVFVLVMVDSELLSGLFPVFLFILVAVIIYDSLAARTTLLIDEEKVNLTDEFTAFIKATGLSRDDIKGYSSLSKNFGSSTDQAREILMSMRPIAQHNLVTSVKAMLLEEASDRHLLSKVFPSFTETQLSIAHLILQDKKQAEICRKLGKSENNISTQRSNIRSKMNLSPDDNLKEALQKAVQEWNDKSQAL